jgi:WD40 repeat protein
MERLRADLLDAQGSLGSAIWADSVIRDIRRIANSIIECAFDCSSTLLVAKLFSETLVAWDAFSGTERWTSTNFGKFIERTKINRGGVISASRCSASMVVDAEQNIILAPRPDHFAAWDIRDGTLLGAWQIRAAGFAITSVSGVFVVAELDPPGRVLALNPRTNASALLFQSGEDGLRSCAVISGLPIIVAGGAKGLITVIDARTRAAITTRRAYEHGVSLCSVSKDGRHLITGDGKAVTLWTLPELNEHESIRGLQAPAAFSPDSKFLVSSTSPHPFELTIWELATGEESARLLGHSSRIRCCAYTSDGSKIISGDDDGTVLVWDTRHHDSAERSGAPSDYLRFCAFSADGRTLATADDGGLVQLWDANDLTRRCTLKADAFTKWAVGPDGSTLVSAGKYGVKLWDATKGCELATLPIPGNESLPVNAQCAIAPDRQGAVIRYAKSILIWNLKSGTATSAETRGVFQGGCAFTPDARWLLTNEMWGVHVRSPSTGIERGMTLDPAYQSDGILCFAVSPGGDFVVTGDTEGRLRIWDWPPDSMTAGGNIVNLIPTLQLRASTSRILGCAVGVGGRLIASAGNEGMVRIWDAHHGEALGSLPVPGVSCIALHPLRPFLVVGTSSGDVLFADLRQMPTGSRSNADVPQRNHSSMYRGPTPIRAVPQAPEPSTDVWLKRMDAIHGGWKNDSGE